jgi:hypothetical protein
MLKDMHSLFENFEYKGSWWLPEDPVRKISGILTYKSGDRITLALLGSLQGGDLDDSEKHKNPSIVHGIAEGNRVCTLQGLLRTTSSFVGGNEAHSSSYLVNRLFEGKHFDCPDDIRFSSVSSQHMCGPIRSLR